MKSLLPIQESKQLKSVPSNSYEGKLNYIFLLTFLFLKLLLLQNLPIKFINATEKANLSNNYTRSFLTYSSGVSQVKKN